MWSVITVLDVASPDVEAVVTAAQRAADHMVTHDDRCLTIEVHRDLYTNRVALVQRYRDTDGDPNHTDTTAWGELQHRIAELSITTSTTITSTTITSHTPPAAPTEEPT
jgi:hypothetical protein